MKFAATCTVLEAFMLNEVSPRKKDKYQKVSLYVEYKEI